MSGAATLDWPAHVPADHVVDFDMYHPPAVEAGFHDSWASLQADGVPDMVWTPHNGGHWIATRAPLIAEVLGDPSRFSSRIIMVPKADGEHHKMIPTTIDPPEHRPWRMLLNDQLDPRAIRRVEDQIRSIAVDLIEAVRADGRCDFIAAFASQLPILIFLKLVDLPAEDAPRLKWLTDQITRPDGSISFQDTVAEFHAYLDGVVSERRGTDRDDMFSRIINGRVEGRALDQHEALQLCSQVLIAGLDTVVNFLGFMMHHLATHPAERDRLAADFSLIPAAMNELLRRYPIVSIGREARTDLEFGGVTVKAGDMVIAPTVLAGLDERNDPAARTTDFDRRPPQHLTFGINHHRCPGAHLARTELVVSLEECLSRMPNVRLAPGTEVRYSGGIVGCLESLPIEWDA
ncbi:cytochrome P450 [Sphingomonas sp. 1P06PA]|uniref:cytochrome P450 n=1 Tax=Sphingomonas sp. 1P06PA TaxID=554121 RepID=UPI0039A69709